MSRLTLDLQTAIEGNDCPGEPDFRRWAETAWMGDTDTEVTIRLVSPEESSNLNHTYRDRNRPTNVLSFPFEAPDGLTIPLLGDLVICADVVAREARDQGKSLSAHWAHMVIHGMLHLQGYDHINDADADVMEALEIRLLAGLGIANPYVTEETDKDS
ncbi:putative rRNA maturation factor [Tamilnaduibacter salinus]|uniref:Endoribonuclease YbeY n=1 Tax=Tamilnaduibacter salinus TaxID=1484056 RepID=A0A2U1CUK2_9GAMM|nr:rRNA maturation RNase YbeY [Tamilnaduibacter salinus]PVY70736.1 putative rRNA maturation factor [Tamilnaduibacter salinus]